MDKEEALWVIIRAAGLIFLVLAFTSFVGVASLTSYFIYAEPVVNTALGAEIAEKTTKTLLVRNVVHFILYSCATYYFMCKGAFVHNVLSK